MRAFVFSGKMDPMTTHPAQEPHTHDDDARLHGEYKVPGGKLVVVDLEVANGRFSNVSLSGDFFLEPDEALEDINRALTGLQENSTAADIAAAVNAGLPPRKPYCSGSPQRRWL